MVPMPLPTPKEFEDYDELRRKAEKYDKLMKQPECPAPDKVEWDKRLREFMEREYGLKPKKVLAKAKKGK